MFNQFANVIVATTSAMPVIIPAIIGAIVIYNIPFVKNWFKSIS